MKNSILFSAIALLLLSCSAILNAQQGVGINTSGVNPNQSAMIDVSSTTKGALIPRMTTAQRNAIVSPATGLFIYNLDCNNFDYYNGYTWMPINPSAASVTISANPSGAICPGSNITFTANALFGGTSPFYQWKLNGADVGTDTCVYSSSSLQNGDQVYCIMTSNAPCVTGSPASSNIITIIHTTVPTILSVIPDTGCGSVSLTLGATASGGVINWYDVPTGGTSLGTGTTFNTPVISTTTSYYVDATLNGCTSPSRTLVTATIISHTIGENFGGGITAYLDGTGCHGFIVASSDQAHTNWGCSGTSISTSTALGTGAANTTAIVAACSTSGIAAEVCYNLSLNGYSDWYLPSKDELYIIYQNKTAIGGIADDFYWSSSEGDSSNAWGCAMDSGGQQYLLKTDSRRTRAIRTF